jgi:hypothetical protein
MAWVEHTSGQHWRICYRHADGTITSEGGFTTPTTAHARAQRDRRRPTPRHLLRPTHGHTTINQWLPRWWTTLTLDDTTLENYHCSTAFRGMRDFWVMRRR